MATRLETRSLDKAITVLETLGREGQCTLGRLHELTGIPKSTLRRLLATLLRRRVIRQSPSDEQYRSNVVLPFAGQQEVSVQAAQFVEIAYPHMLALTREIRWPSDLHIFDRGRMRILESTRTFSQIQVRRARLDLDVNIFVSACGRAYLSELDDHQISEIIEMNRDDSQFGLAAYGIDERQLRKEVADTRKRGYAARHPGYFGENADDDQLCAIAVTITDADAVMGTLNICWNHHFSSTEDFADKFLAPLNETVNRITADLSAIDQPAPRH